MKIEEKIKFLKAKISQQLQHLIGKKCILIDLPYYDNLGDVLIWQGELDFLKSIDTSVLQSSSSGTFLYPKLTDDTSILLQGGGNFGDLYRNFQDFRLSVIKAYPKNRIIMFPQSVWYNDKSLIRKDAEIISQHSDLYLCARDKWSYDFLISNFPKCKILLVPDMAFYVNDNFLAHYRNYNTGKSLHVKRIDKESVFFNNANDENKSDYGDWPKYGDRTIGFNLMSYGSVLINKTKSLIFIPNVIATFIDAYANKYWRNSRLKLAASYIAQYDTITTDRLHAMILSLLLHKSVEFKDNYTGKLKAYYETWLSDLDCIKPANN